MSRPRNEDRIALLLAQGEAQRLAAALAIHEARGQLAPLRSAVGVVGVVTRALSPGGAGGAIGALARLLVGHPMLSSALLAGGWRLLRARPAALLVAAAAGAAAWWLLRPGSAAARPAREP
jgi:hypothetical protein